MVGVYQGRPEKPMLKLAVKRTRISSSCFNCRRKKVKCDKQKPCSRCTKSGQGDQCKYEVIKWANTSIEIAGNIMDVSPTSNKPNTVISQGSQNDSRAYIVQLEKEVASLKLQVELRSITLKLPDGHPPVDPLKTISLYEGYNPVQLLEGQFSNNGPFNWCTFVKKDKFLKLGWYSIFLSQDNLTNPTGSITGSQKAEFISSFLPSGYKGLRGILQVSKLEKVEKHNFIKSTNASHDEYKMKELKYKDGFGTQSQIKAYLLNILPKQKVFWICIRRFFRYSYPLMPYLDQAEFIDDTVELIEPTAFVDKPFTRMDIKRNSDYSKMAVILLVVALGYLTLGTLDVKDRVLDKDVIYLMQNPVGLELSRAAYRCVHQFQDSLTADLPTLQALLYLKSYSHFSPESSEFSNPSSRVINGVILQMAFSLGINHDHQDISNLSPQEQKKFNLKRKIWLGIRSLDFYQSYIFGDGGSVVTDDSNGHLPERPTEINKNAFDLKLDTISFEKLSERAALEKLITENLGCVLDMKNRINIIKLINSIQTIETYLSNKYGSFSDIVMRETQLEHVEAAIFYFSKLVDLVNYLGASTLCFMVRYHLFLQFELENDLELALYYFKKLFNSCFHFAEFSRYAVDNSLSLFDNSFQYLVIPSLELTFHRHKKICWSALIRLAIYKGNLLIRDQLSEGLEMQITRSMMLLINISQLFLSVLNKLSQKYYYSWKLGKVHLRMHSIIFAPLERGNMPFQVVVDPKTGQKSLNLKWDENNVIILPKSSFISNYTEDDLSKLYSTMKRSVDLALSQTFLLQPIAVDQNIETSANVDIFGVSDSIISSVEVENFWKDHILDSRGFDENGVSQDLSFEIFDQDIKFLFCSEQFDWGNVLESNPMGETIPQ